ncbi:MAG TPA: hypothetical protein VFI08_14440, partial [Spirochaetia bacterium]|nr:hypothetical protein [Spirochaetia bacterium]
YDCLEQVTSKLFARVLFPTLATGAADLSTLVRFANEDGGFSYWDDPSPRRSNYYVTLRVAHLLAAARDKGIRIPDEINQAAMLSYLDANYDKPWVGTYLQAYALYVLTRYGKDESERADAMAKRGDDIGVFGYGFVGLAYDAMGNARAAQAVLTRLKNFVRVGTRTVTLVGTVNDWMWYGGNLQAKALLLMLYARVAPDSQLVLGLANDLLAANSTGYWENTSNAGWILQAFSEIVTKGHETNADFTASVKLGTSELAKNRFRGFSRNPFRKQVTAADLAAAVARERGRSAPTGTMLPLTLGLTGTGTLYYTAELRTAMLASAAEPRDEGIGIATEIRDDTGTVVSATDLGLGKVYTMKVVFYSSKDRSYVALRAPIPSGAEPIDGSLLTSQIVKPPAAPDQGSGDTGDSGDGSDQGYTGDYGEFGYTTHIYDDEVRFYFDQLDRGRHEVSFLFRTTTPGLFPTPPVTAECMYQPEVFGRTGGTTVRISDK